MKNWKLSLIILISVFSSCSQYKGIKKPLHNAPAYIEWYFFDRSKQIRNNIQLKNPTYDKHTLDSLTNIEIGKIMLSISSDQYVKIKQAYDQQHYNIFVNQ